MTLSVFAPNFINLTFAQYNEILISVDELMEQAVSTL